MKLVETKTYKIKMDGTEITDLYKFTNKLEEIADIFRYKNVYYTAIDSGEHRMDIEKIDIVVEFLRALVNCEVEVD